MRMQRGLEEACTGVFTATTGLPCAHEMKARKDENPDGSGALTIDDIHPHWRFEKPAFYTTREPLRGVDEIQQPNDPVLTVREPAVARPKGRPNGPRELPTRAEYEAERSTRRIPSQFEQVDSLNSTPLGTPPQMPTTPQTPSTVRATLPERCRARTSYAITASQVEEEEIRAEADTWYHGEHIRRQQEQDILRQTRIQHLEQPPRRRGGGRGSRDGRGRGRGRGGATAATTPRDGANVTPAQLHGMTMWQLD